jgi:membrane-bound metal-dependent hydrolase YbcI (DUF457 family)
VGAIAGLLPDIDISTSPAGRILPWVSSFFESKMPHRSCTHSLVASGAIAIVGYGVALFNPSFVNLVHALNVGYFFGWFADCFTRGGVEMFWPSPVRCVCPGNRDLRLRTGSNAEYFVLVLLIAIALFTFNVNNSGGLLTQFNRLIAAPSGVQKIYNESGSTHLIKANIKGVRTSDGYARRRHRTASAADIALGSLLTHFNGFKLKARKQLRLLTEPYWEKRRGEAQANTNSKNLCNTSIICRGARPCAPTPSVPFFFQIGITQPKPNPTQH